MLFLTVLSFVSPSVFFMVKGYVAIISNKKFLEVNMNEDKFNMEIRKFLKQVGVTSLREI